MTYNDIWDNIEQVWTIEATAIEKLKQSIDKEALLAIIKAIETCVANQSRILITGSGTSAAIAKKIAHTFSCVEIPAFFLSPIDAVHGGLGALQNGDLLIAVSKGGETSEVLDLVAQAKKKGGAIVAVTESNISKLAAMCDFPLIIKTDKEADPFNLLATASAISVIAVFDAIAVVLMQHSKYTKERFALIHPYGAVGRKLLSPE